MADMGLRRTELASLEKRQMDSRAQVGCFSQSGWCVADSGQLRELLDIKQQRANIIEAKAAIRRRTRQFFRGAPLLFSLLS